MVSEPIYGHLMSFNYWKQSRFLFKSFYIRRLQEQSFFERKNEVSFNASNREINRVKVTAIDKRQIQVENFSK